MEDKKIDYSGTATTSEERTSEQKSDSEQKHDHNVFNKGYTLVPEISELQKKREQAKRFQNRNFQFQPNLYFNSNVTSETLIYDNRYPNLQTSYQRKPNEKYQRKPLFPLNTINNIRKQINYYFSDENLMKDKYFKSKMDANGFVDVSVIANFPRMKNGKITSELIIKSSRKSKKIEVVGNFLRSADSWWKFVDKNFNLEPESTIENSKPEFMTEDEYNKIKEEEQQRKDESDDEEILSDLNVGAKVSPEDEQNPKSDYSQPYQQYAQRDSSNQYSGRSFYNPFASPYIESPQNAFLKQMEAQLGNPMEQVPNYSPHAPGQITSAFIPSFGAFSPTPWSYEPNEAGYQSQLYQPDYRMMASMAASENTMLYTGPSRNFGQHGGYRGHYQKKGGYNQNEKKNGHFVGKKKNESSEIKEVRKNVEKKEDNWKHTENGKETQGEEEHKTKEMRKAEEDKTIFDTVSDLAKNLEETMLHKNEEEDQNEGNETNEEGKM